MPKAPKSIDIPSKSGGWVVREVARLTWCSTATHTELAPKLWPLVEKFLAMAPAGLDLAYTLPSGDWTEPVPLKRLQRHVASVAKWEMNGTLVIGSVRDTHEYAIDYHGSAKVWIDKRWASTITLTFAREQLYQDPDRVERWFREVLAIAPWTSATVSLALEGNEWKIYPLALAHQALDIAAVGACSHDLGDAVVGIGWLTALASQHVVEGACGKGASLTALDGGGAVLRLGKLPVRGTTPAQRAPYETAARALAAHLHRPKKVLYLSSHPRQLAWHERFLHGADAFRRAFADDGQSVHTRSDVEF